MRWSLIVLGRDDGAVGGGEHRLVPAVVGRQVVGVAGVGAAVLFDDEVDGIVLVGEWRPVVGDERASSRRWDVPFAVERGLDRNDSSA